MGSGVLHPKGMGGLGLAVSCLPSACFLQGGNLRVSLSSGGQDPVVRVTETDRWALLEETRWLLGESAASTLWGGDGGRSGGWYGEQSGGHSQMLLIRLQRQLQPEHWEHCWDSEPGSPPRSHPRAARSSRTSAGRQVCLAVASAGARAWRGYWGPGQALELYSTGQRGPPDSEPRGCSWNGQNGE